MNDPRTAAVLEAVEAEAAALADVRAAFDQDRARVPAGPPASVVAATVALLERHVPPSSAAATRLRIAVAGARATAADGEVPLLWIAGRFTGPFAHVFGRDDRRAAPGDVAALSGRTWGLAARIARARRRLVAAAGADEAAVLLSGGARFLLLVGDTPAVRERVAAERAALEREFLLAFEGEVVPVVSTVATDLGALEDAPRLAAVLAGADRERARAPFLDALEDDDAFGPFGEMSDDAAIEASFGAARELGERLRGARFALAREDGTLEPYADADALREAAAATPEDERLAAVWPGSREGLLRLLEVQRELGGRLVVEPAPLLPVSSADRDQGPLAVVYAQIDGLDGLDGAAASPSDGAGFAGALATLRRADELLRVGAAGLAQGRAISVLFGGGDDLLACGPLRAVLRFTQRLDERVRDELGDERTLSAGIAVASRFARRGPDVARLARQARASFDGAAAAGHGSTSVLGAVCRTREVGRLVSLGDDMVLLAREAPGATRALLEAAMRLGSGGDALPLSAHERLRARVHALAAGLGLHARDLRDAAAPPVNEGLKTLVREFPALFGSGVARVPLAYAVLLSEEVDA